MNRMPPSGSRTMLSTMLLFVCILAFTAANDAVAQNVAAATVETVEVEGEGVEPSCSSPVDMDGACTSNLTDTTSEIYSDNEAEDEEHPVEGEDMRRDPLEQNMQYYPKDAGGKRQWAQGPYRTKMLEWINLSEVYLEEQLAAAESDAHRNKIRKECRNWNMFCTFFAAVQNECPSEVSDQGEGEGVDEVEVEEDDRYMVESCSLSCRVCHFNNNGDDDDGQEGDDRAENTTDDANLGTPSLDESAEIIEEEHEDDDEEDDDDDDDEDILDVDVNDFVLVPSKWGVGQNVIRGLEEQIHQIMEETDDYIEGFSDEENYEQHKEYYDHLQSICVNDDPMCSYYAATGRCEDFEEDAENADNGWYEFMLDSCPAACLLCDEIHISERCPTKDVYAGVWEEAGDLDRFFERVVSDEYYQKEYGPVTLHGNPKEDYDMPWIVTFDNFVTDEECERLIELGAHEGYERSSEVGDENEDGLHDGEHTERRTSTNSWCRDECSKDPVTQRVDAKINNITSLPSENSEFLQMLRYTPGQYYKEHHDYIGQEWDLTPGPRILTVFLYLNDVEAGGGTHFSNLGLTVQPKRGRMVMWPSVLNDYPFRFDPRTHHEALEVEAGNKYGANAWVHQRDFKGPRDVECA